jgi:hypothetical protein
VKLTRIVLLGAVAVLLLTGSDSLAQDRANRALMAAFQTRFDLLDANNDGKVTRQEYLDFHCKRAEVRFDNLDKDKNGHVTREEAKEIAEAAGDKMQKAKKHWQQKRQEQLERQQQQQQEQPPQQ